VDDDRHADQGAANRHRGREQKESEHAVVAFTREWVKPLAA
jgi:hypothetical protein